MGNQYERVILLL